MSATSAQLVDRVAQRLYEAPAPKASGPKGKLEAAPKSVRAFYRRMAREAIAAVGALIPSGAVATG